MTASTLPRHETRRQTQTPDHDDRRLVDRIRAGDEVALRRAYDRHHGHVLTMARRTTGDGRAAEEVAQEVFVYLWRHADRVDFERGSLGAFLTVLTRQRSIDHVRREARWAARQGRAGLLGHAPVETDDVADGVIAAERRGRRAGQLRQAVERLPDAQRRAVELAYFDGRTFRQVAADTGVAEGTAKSRLRLALRRLHQDLQSVGDV